MNGRRKLVDFGVDCIRRNNFYKGPSIRHPEPYRGQIRLERPEARRQVRKLTPRDR
jgi:hypothetical protein